MKKEKKIAIVYDWIDKWGGVERVLLTLHEMFPNAVFYTSVYDRKSAGWAKGLKIKTSFMQGLPWFIKNNRILSVPFYGPAFESLDLKGFDLVISVTSSFAKSVVTPPETLHVCYLLTPTRFLWSHRKSYFKKNFFTGLFQKYLQKWDKVVAHRPDRIISISKTVSDRCKKYYGIDTPVIYPPFDTKHWSSIKREIAQDRSPIDHKYFLVVSRLEAYKRVDLVIKAFSGSKDRLVVVGEGTMLEYLRKIADKNVTFLSRVSDRELGSLYKNARALIMPQTEDFGYVSLEAQFFGTPVISNMKGGASETVIDGKTGILIEGLSKTLLRQAIARFKRIGYNLKANVMASGEKAVLKFDEDNFKQEFSKNL